MNINTKQIAAIISIALLGCNYASAQTVPDTHNQNITDLGALSIGSLPAGISTVVSNLQGYQAAEVVVEAGLQNDIANTETNISNIESTIANLQVAASNQQVLIQNLIIADPLDPNIPIEQGVLSLIQADIVTENGNLATEQGVLAGEQADLAESQLKIALFNSALDASGPVVAAQDAASAAASVITQAVTDYSTVNTNPDGLEDIIADIASVSAGDQVPVTTAITDADTVFAASGGSLSDIQTLVGVINAELPNLPPISAVDQQTAIDEVSDGAYERVAIADNTASIANVQADVDQNEIDSDAADAAITAAFTAADAVIQTDVDQNEADSDAADAFITAAYTAADAVIQAGVDQNSADIASNRADIERNARGIAMVAALQHTTVLPGMTQALDLSAAHYEGETGMALNYSRRINDTTQINFGVAATSDFDESVIKGGIGWQW